MGEVPGRLAFGPAGVAGGVAGRLALPEPKGEVGAGTVAGCTCGAGRLAGGGVAVVTVGGCVPGLPGVTGGGNAVAGVVVAIAGVADG